MVVNVTWVWSSICFVAVVGGVAAAAICNVNIKGATYREENVVTDVDRAHGLAVDFTTNQLYFSYFKNEMSINAKADLGTGDIKNIEELSGLCRFTIDRVHDEVRAGCVGDIAGHGGGLFQFDSHPNKFVLVGESGLRVQFVHYNKMLYYSYYDWMLLHTFRRGHRIRVPDLPSQVRGLVIGKNRDWVFHNDTGLYRQQAGASIAKRYAGLDLTQVAAVDGSGTVFVSDWGRNHGIYRLHERPPAATKLLDVKVCTGLTFDREDNMIYSNGTRIVRLVRC